MEINDQFSDQMFDQTERPGNHFPLDTHQIISHRYHQSIPFIKGKDVLEVGAGHGIGSRLLSQHAKSYVAGEYSHENVELLKKREGSFKVVQMDAHQMPFEDQSFDVVMALAMIYYLDLEKFLDEVKRVLRPGGVLYFCTSNKDVPGFVNSPYITRYYSTPELDEILRKYGFNAQFRGAFPASEGSLLLLKLKALIKNSAKFLVCLTPTGKNWWARMRHGKDGERYALPWHVDEIPLTVESAVPIPANVVDKRHRIIYSICTKN